MVQNSVVAGSQVTIRAHLTDDTSGLIDAYTGGWVSEVRYKAPTTEQFVNAYFYFGRGSSGTPTDAEFEILVEIPEFAEAGTWTLDWIFVADAAGNYETLAPDTFAQRGFHLEFELIVPGSFDVTCDSFIDLL